MAESQLSLNADERTFLAELLEIALKERLVEEHRTRASTFREHILQQERLIESILSKLGKPAG